MTSEEAFRKWRTDYESDYDKKPSYLEVWQAAIAYMQERDKLVEHCCPECGCHFVGEFPFKYKVKQNKYSEQSDKDNSLQKAFDLTRNTTQQRQQPLKRLDEITIDEIFSTYTDEQGYVAIDDWHLLTNAIMDAMQELNK